MRVVSLHVYPIKGTRAHDLERALVASRGLDGDRRWLVIDAHGRFATQRSHALLATITAKPTNGGLTLAAQGMPDLHVARPDGAQRCAVTIWEQPVDAALAGGEAHAWLSKYFAEDLRLAYMDDAAQRVKEGIWAPPLPVSFADAYPVLIATTASLAALNAAIEGSGNAPVPMRRFRPNIVVDAADPWAEDTWRSLRIGKAELELVKPCDRCVVTTKDQLTGATMGDEPLGALRRLRMSADPRVKGVLFGWNAAPRTLAEIAVGDEVEILATRPEGFAIYPPR